MELLSMKVCLSGEMMTTVRLATGGVCSCAGLDLDASEDCKLCVTESILLLRNSGYRMVCITFEEGEDMAVRVTGCELGRPAEKAGEDEISFALLEALAEDVTTEKEGDRLSAVGFRFKHGR